MNNPHKQHNKIDGGVGGDTRGVGTDRGGKGGADYYNRVGCGGRWEELRPVAADSCW